MGAGDNSNPRSNYAFLDYSEDADLSEACECGGLTCIGIEIPSALDGTEITIHARRRGGTTFGPVNAAGTVMTYTVAVSQIVKWDAFYLRGCDAFKVETTTDQTADRSFYPIWSDERP